MLKLTYTDSGSNLEPLTLSLEEWVNARVLIALRSGMPLWIEASTANFLIPADLPYLTELTHLARRDLDETFELTVCDRDSVEVSLSGTWLASDANAEEGVFVCRLSDRVECLLYQLWLSTQYSTSILNE